MSNFDDELLKDAEDDARAIAYIYNYLPMELKEKFTEDELYYFLDVIIEYYTTSEVFNAEEDEDGYVEIDLDEVVNYIIKKAKKDPFGEYEHDDILFVVQGELAYSESVADEE